jgi:protein O-GlcNAc transferase
MNINDAIQIALKHEQAGDLKEAESIYKEILKFHPENADVLHLIGLLYYQNGNYDSAITYIRKALQFNPNAEIYNNLGTVLRQKGHFDEAIYYYQKAIQLNPNFATAHNNIGTIFQSKGLLNEAIVSYEKALQIDQNLADTYFNLGTAFREKELLDAAVFNYQKAIQLNPNFAIAYNNLGNVFDEKGEEDKAITYYQHAIQLNPAFSEAYFNIGRVMTRHNKMNEALASFDQALRYKPDFIKAQWVHCMSILPIIFSDESSINTCRNQYSNELMMLKESISLKTQQEIAAAFEAVGSSQPFYLACHGMNDRELQKIYGKLVSRIMASTYPELSRLPEIPARLSEEPIRVGIVTGFFRDHSIWKIPVRGWVENLDRQRFRLYGYHTGKIKDQTTQIASQNFRKFVGDIHSFDEMCSIIKSDNLQVLLYPEIGMDAMTLKLAALRLAPVQCNALGHPDTSGLPTIDYFLSSDLMEPPDADNHYTEKLIRLPNLSVYYAPLDILLTDINRDTFGFRPESVLYLCSHSLFTHLPQYDEIYPRIVQQVGDCQFIFISHKSSIITEQFRLRIERTFNRFGMNANNYVVFLQPLDAVRYHAMNCISDVFLDTIGWSGFNSSCEAIACNLPIVTLPGKLMRQRHCFAVLSMIGVKETVVSTIQDYVDLAVKLGKDAEYRRMISEKIADNKYRIHNDRTCITALEDFMEKAVRERLFAI